MSKITLTNIGSLTTNPTTAQSEINSNFGTIQSAFDNTLSRDGTAPNPLSSQLDMNNNQIINLPNPATANSPARLQDLSTLVNGGTISNIPTGGTTGQVLSKNSSANYDIGWAAPANLSAGSNISISGSNPTTIATIADPSFATSVTTPEILNFTGTLAINSSGTMTLQNATDTIVGRATTDTLTNKTFDTAGTGNTFKINGTGITTVTGSGDVVLATSPSALSGVALSSMASQAANTLTGNATTSSASPTAFTVGSLTQKVSPASTDLLLLQDQAASGALKYATVSSISSAGSVSSIAGNTGAFTLSSGITNSTNDIELNGAYTGWALSNLGLSASVASNILTVNVTDNAGSTPSSTSPVFLTYRSATAATGSISLVKQTSALSISTNATGATLGTFNGIPFRIWVVCFNNSGTNVLALWQSVTGGSTPSAIAGLNEAGVASTTGISGTATSAGTFYSPNGTTIASMPFRVLGYLEWASGLTTAGSYASGPTTIQIFNPSVRLPGAELQSVYTLTQTNDTGTTSTSYVSSSFTASITPISACNIIQAQCSSALNSAGSNATAARLVRGSTVIGSDTVGAANGGVPCNFIGFDAPGSTSSQTYTVQRKTNNAATTAQCPFLNGGATNSGAIILKEIMV